MPTRIITALLLCFATALAQADPAPPEIADNAPDRHVVVAGDTLWGIAGKFLKEPWRWPEIWRLNREEINSPHRIYPGQVVILDRSSGTPRLKLGQMLASGTSTAPGAETVRLEPRTYEDRNIAAIPTIPPRAIQPFLSEPRIVEADTLEKAPRIAATEEDRVMLGVGNIAYAVGITGKDTVWQAYRPAKPLKDPETGEVLGFEAFYLGSLRVSRRASPGELTTLEVVTSKREMATGDQLMAAASPDVEAYAPHAPAKPLEGRVASIYEGVGEAGPQSIVTINRGKAQGLEPGHVLAIYHRGKGIKVKEMQGEVEEEKLYLTPDTRVGLLLVFSVHERLSYALVMNSRRPVGVGDIVRQP